MYNNTTYNELFDLKRSTSQKHRKSNMGTINGKNAHTNNDVIDGIGDGVVFVCWRFLEISRGSSNIQDLQVFLMSLLLDRPVTCYYICDVEDASI